MLMDTIFSSYLFFRATWDLGVFDFILLGHWLGSQ